MRGDDRWEKPWHSIPIGAIPGEPIGLQSAVRLIIERKSGDDAGDQSPAISFGAEFMNMWHGGSKLKADLEERSELARAEGIETAARNWIKEHLRTGKLRLFRDGAPLKLSACESEFWQRSDRAGVFIQTSILDREGDENGDYVLDRPALMALLKTDPATHERDDAGYIGAGAPETSVPIRPAIDAVAPTSARRGRKKGSGTKPDDPSLSAMLDLLAHGRALSVLAAARSVVEETGPSAGNNEMSTQSWIDRLRHKFAAKYGTEPPPGKTWDDVRKDSGV